MTQVSRLDVFLGLDSAAFEQGARKARGEFTRFEAGVRQGSERIVRAQGNVAASMGRLRGAVGQLGLQLQDAVIQLGQGVRPLQVLAQQGAQVAGALGPVGAVIGAVGAGVAILADTVLRYRSEAAAAEEAQRNLAEELERASRSIATQQKSVDELVLAYARLQGAARIGERAALERDIGETTKKLNDNRRLVAQIVDEMEGLTSKLRELPGVAAPQLVEQLSKALGEFERGGHVARLVEALDELRERFGRLPPFVTDATRDLASYAKIERELIGTLGDHEARLRALLGIATAADLDRLFPAEAAKRFAKEIERLVEVYPDVTAAVSADAEAKAIAAVQSARYEQALKKEREAAAALADEIERLVRTYPDVGFTVSPELDARVMREGMAALYEKAQRDAEEARRVAERQRERARQAAEQRRRDELEANREHTRALAEAEQVRWNVIGKMRLDEAQKIMDRLNLVYDEGKRLAEQYATAEAALAERMSILRAARDRRFIDDAVLAKASIDAQREAIDRQVEQLRRYGTALDGVRAAILRYRADAQNASEVAADFTATALEGVERGLAGLVGMVARAETSWDALGKAATSALGTIAEEVARLAIRTQIIAPLFNALFGGQAIFGGAGAEIAAGAGVGGDRLAKGGVIDHGAIKRFATGGVVQRPTLFPMRGGVGLMGEAGPEAVLPLRRNARGELGVQAPPAATVVQIIDQRRGDAPEIEVRRQRGPGGEMLIEAYVREAVGREIARGALRAPMRQEFGLRPALHPRG